MSPGQDPPEVARYARQLALPHVGMPGQARLWHSRVVVVGAGGLGSPALLYLAAAGVGTLGVVDDDLVEVANLHRQLVHPADAVGRLKTRSAADSLARTNPAITVIEHSERLRADNALEILGGYDVVVDGSDNLRTRYAVNDACVVLGLAHVWGGVLGFEGQASVWWAGQGPCYRCVFPERSGPVPPPSCAEAGVLGPVCAAIGAVQATEALKILLGVGESLVGRLLLHDALRQTWDTVAVRADPRCPTCGEGAPRSRRGKPPRASETAAPAGHPDDAQPVTQLEPGDLAAHLSNSGAVLLDVRDETERTWASIPGSVSIPLEQFRTGTAFSRPELADPARPVVVFCSTGSRSEQAARLGRRAGYARIASLRGGVVAWQQCQSAAGAGS